MENNRSNRSDKVKNGARARWARFVERIKPKLIEDNFRYYLQMTVIPGVFAIVSLIMCILNIFTDKHTLMIATAVFSACSFVETFVTYFFLKNKIKIAFFWFAVNVFMLFTYFIIFGGTEGFSTIWLLLLPSFLCFFIGLRGGVIGSAIMLLELIFFFWSPFGRSLIVCQDYTVSFLMRFPIIYIVCLILGFLLELLRKLTYTQLKSVEEAYRSVSTVDSLTGIYNRYWLDSYMDNSIRQYDGSFVFMMMVDIDHFKNFNDAYGHLVGDEILKQTAQILLREKGHDTTVARWGGEEFVLFGTASDRTDALDRAEYIRQKIENTEFFGGNTLPNASLHVTISIGVAGGKCVSDVNSASILKIADEAMYESKANGRNTVTYKNF